MRAALLLRPASDRPDLVPVYTFNDEDLVVVGQGQRVSPSSNRKWKDLLARLEAELRGIQAEADRLARVGRERDWPQRLAEVERVLAHIRAHGPVRAWVNGELLGEPGWGRWLRPSR